MKDDTIARLLKIGLIVGAASLLAPLAVHAQGIGVDELSDMLVPTPQKIERGETLYEDNCADCHGQNGSGRTDVSLAGSDEAFETTDFTEAEYDYGGGPIQIYNTITFGLEEAVVDEPEDELPNHPTYEHLQYQSRWDIVHYVRSLGPTSDLQDPPELLDEARQIAEEGICDESVREEVSDRVEPKGEDQLAEGEEIYDQQCASCHGDEGKGDGPAGAALDPPARNFTTESAGEWTKAPNPFDVFDVVTNGIEGTSMASFDTLSEDERWAVTHYVMQFVPDDVAEEPGDEAITSVCRSLSAPEKPDSIPVDTAMQALIEDQPEERIIRSLEYGQPEVDEGADRTRGEQIYAESCATCHGSAGSGGARGPYGSLPPFLYIDINRLAPEMAGGTAEDFAQRSYSGVHTTLPEMSSAAMLSQGEWRDLHAYVAGVGDAQIDEKLYEDAAVQEARGLDRGEADTDDENGDEDESPDEEGDEDDEDEDDEDDEQQDDDEDDEDDEEEEDEQAEDEQTDEE
ncbi:MAG: cytochrome c [Persicimonas sp.]